MAEQQPNHYRVLDVPFTATRAEITSAYRRAMRQWHPDQFRGSDLQLAEENAKRLNHAYSVLSNPHQREVYDRSLRVEAIQTQIMERYVAGSSGWNLDGSGPLPADAPRRPLTTHQRNELRRSDRGAMRSTLTSFAIFAIAAILLLLLFTVMNTVIGAVF